MTSLLTTALVRSAADEYGTPFYLFEEHVIRTQCRLLKQAICYPNTVFRYACKALSIRGILRIVRDAGFAIDCCSLNEVKRALLAGITPDDILCTTESASRRGLRELVDTGVVINCGSMEQLQILKEIAPETSVSIRINPERGLKAVGKIDISGPSSKLGISVCALEQVKELTQSRGPRIRGIHAHIGWGPGHEHWLDVHEETFRVLNQFEDIEFVNLGGGLPVAYPYETSVFDLNEWGRRLSDRFQQVVHGYGKRLELQVEPGRFIVAASGHLVATVESVRQTSQYVFAVLDTGSNHNILPFAFGKSFPLRLITSTDRSDGESGEYVIAGNLCSAGDLMTVDADRSLIPRRFSHIQVGDLIVADMVGAYCYSMMNNFNSIGRPTALLLEQSGRAKMIERSETIDDMVRREV